VPGFLFWKERNFLRDAKTQDYTADDSNTPAKRLEWEGKSFSFFQNKSCEWFPCHKTKDIEKFNCLFCYCPLYALDGKCGGNFSYTAAGVKNCVGCLFPHVKENYGLVTERFNEIAAMMKNNRDKPAQG
jgi:Zn-finger protein